ncbi:MAG: 5-(carboxyamino)imidazole ribonucleotide synthase [Bdellovibrionales bacterium]|nr:5-(carboxyamino)imidazole ribonucleotide synthase [Bdellovibrionales bacterium]
MKMKTIGILGGGQLARMMALKGHNLGLNIHILSPTPKDPAAQVTSQWHKGELNSVKDLKSLYYFADIVTFESEFLDPVILKKSQQKFKTEFSISPSVLSNLQDRLSQKSLLEKHKLPTSAFYQIKSKADIKEYPVVIKQRRFGYDGYGTLILKTKPKSLKLDSPTGYIAESFVPFKRELAITAVRNKKKQIQFFPLVESFQQDSKCLWVKGPIKHAKINALKTKISKFLDSIQYIGCMAFELFETQQGELLINEIAPRVHNSAHYSLEGCNWDQFSMHLLACLNCDLPEIKVISPFAMYNLIGSGTKAPKLKVDADGFLHWYGKDKNRKGRKMGHINYLDSSPDKALKQLSKIIKEHSV